MRITVCGKRWELKFVPLRKNDGTCEGPHVKQKEIRIDSRIRGVDRFETLLHEQIHAACWWLDEEHVHHLAKDIATNFWKLGYRKVNDVGTQKDDPDYW